MYREFSCCTRYHGKRVACTIPLLLTTSLVLKIAELSVHVIRDMAVSNASNITGYRTSVVKYNVYWYARRYKRYCGEFVPEIKRTSNVIFLATLIYRISLNGNFVQCDLSNNRDYVLPNAREEVRERQGKLLGLSDKCNKYGRSAARRIEMTFVCYNKPEPRIPAAFCGKKYAVFSSLPYKHRWPFSIFRKQHWPLAQRGETLSRTAALYFLTFRRPRRAKLKYLRTCSSNASSSKIFRKSPGRFLWKCIA